MLVLGLAESQNSFFKKVNEEDQKCIILRQGSKCSAANEDGKGHRSLIHDRSGPKSQQATGGSGD